MTLHFLPIFTPYQAIQIVAKAVKDGSLLRQPCEVCGASKKVHAHHDDYGKPLAVRWLCPSHHHEAHGRTAGTTQRRKVPENYKPEKIVLHRRIKLNDVGKRWKNRLKALNALPADELIRRFFDLERQNDQLREAIRALQQPKTSEDFTKVRQTPTSGR